MATRKLHIYSGECCAKPVTLVKLPYPLTPREQVKNVYYTGADQAVYERQEKSNQTNAWASDNFSGLYKASRESSLAVYWSQNVTNTSQALLVAFQEQDRPNLFTVGKYTSWNNVSNPWISTKYNFTVLEGSPLALLPFTSWKDLMLYAAGPDGKLTQFRYNLTSDEVQQYGGESREVLTAKKNCEHFLTQSPQ
jgi:hypothetical protein